MYSKKLNEELSRFQTKIIGLDEETFAQGYGAMADINLELSQESYHLETQATYTVENFIGKDEKW